MVYHDSDVVIYLHYGVQAVLRQKHQHLECPSPLLSVVEAESVLPGCRLAVHCIHMATEEDIIVGAELHYDLRFLSLISFL